MTHSRRLIWFYGVLSFAAAAAAVDECTALCPTCARQNCTAAGQLCEDVDANTTGSWVCRCAPPLAGVGYGAPAVCRPEELTPRRLASTVAVIGDVAAGLGVLGSRGVPATRFAVLHLDCPSYGSNASQALPFALHPTRVALGEGAALDLIAGNVLVVAAVAVLMWGAVCGLAATKLRKWGRNAVEARCWYPSLPLSIALSLLPGTALGGFDLVFRTASRTGAALGVVTLALLAAGVYDLHRRVRPHVVARAHLQMDRSHEHGRAYRFMLGSEEWVDTPHGRASASRWGCLLRPYSLHAARSLATGDLAVTFAVAFLHAGSGWLGTAGCGGTKLVLAALCAVWLSVLVKARPFRVRRVFVGEVAVLAMEAVALAVSGAAWLSASDGAFFAADVLFVIAAALMLVHTGFDAACEVVLLATGRRSRIQNEAMGSFRFDHDLRMPHRIALRDDGCASESLVECSDVASKVLDDTAAAQLHDQTCSTRSASALGLHQSLSMPLDVMPVGESSPDVAEHDAVAKKVRPMGCASAAQTPPKATRRRRALTLANPETQSPFLKSPEGPAGVKATELQSGDSTSSRSLGSPCPLELTPSTVTAALRSTLFSPDRQSVRRGSRSLAVLQGWGQEPGADPLQSIRSAPPASRRGSIVRTPRSSSPAGTPTQFQSARVRVQARHPSTLTPPDDALDHSLPRQREAVRPLDTPPIHPPRTSFLSGCASGGTVSAQVRSESTDSALMPPRGLMNTRRTRAVTPPRRRPDDFDVLAGDSHVQV
eukprot:TRINITY_DN7492_c0_g3_i1.p1 TRINITY_DN7492_c0_g3~~TRINITY_DN7492_c0_g3_i1.p1  ORF type:complete len:769 (+),score=146.71 TRINITY_DN7492_c0_g3_i1:65-2371(+)